jgi:hypothetical protein
VTAKIKPNNPSKSFIILFCTGPQPSEDNIATGFDTSNFRTFINSIRNVYNKQQIKKIFFSDLTLKQDVLQNAQINAKKRNYTFL